MQTDYFSFLSSAYDSELEFYETLAGDVIVEAVPGSSFLCEPVNRLI